MPSVSYFSPNLERFPNPAEEFLRSLFLNIDLRYWRQGECDVALRAYDDFGNVVSELYIRLKVPNEFCVVMDEMKPLELVLSSDPGNHAVSQIYDGQEYKLIPKSHLCTPEAALHACLTFCRTFGGRDAADFWIPYDPFEPDESEEDREDYEWNDSKVP